MLRVAFDISVIVVVYLAGYRMGYKACFEFLQDELRKWRENR